MQELKIFKHKINKRVFETIRNLEFICFIPHKFIKTCIDFLKSQIILDNELFIYIKKNWFKHDFSYYNYQELFPADSLYLIMVNFYSTNNVNEALHDKLA